MTWLSRKGQPSREAHLEHRDTLLSSVSSCAALGMYAQRLLGAVHEAPWPSESSSSCASDTPTYTNRWSTGTCILTGRGGDGPWGRSPEGFRGGSPGGFGDGPSRAMGSENSPRSQLRSAGSQERIARVSDIEAPRAPRRAPQGGRSPRPLPCHYASRNGPCQPERRGGVSGPGRS